MPPVLELAHRDLLAALDRHDLRHSGTLSVAKKRRSLTAKNAKNAKAD